MEAEEERKTLINAIADKFLQIDISCTILSRVDLGAVCRVTVRNHIPQSGALLPTAHYLRLLTTATSEKKNGFRRLFLLLL